MAVLGRTLAALLVLVWLAWPTLARADREPNDARVQAEGPVAGGVDIAGTLSGAGDVDHLLFYTQGEHRLVVTSSVPSCTWLLDADGAPVAGGADEPITRSTPPHPAAWFIAVRGSACRSGGDPPLGYSLRIDPRAAVGSGRTMPVEVPTGEPNDRPGQATGPLTDLVTYGGRIDTSDDEDWLAVAVGPGREYRDINVISSGSGCSGGLQYGFHGTDGEDLGLGGSVEDDRVGHLRVVLLGPTVKMVRLTAECAGTTWQVRVGGALTDWLPGTAWPAAQPAPPPAPPPDVQPPAPAPPGAGQPVAPAPVISATCRRARGRVVTLKRKVATLDRRASRATGARRVRLRRQARNTRARLHVAYRVRRSACPSRAS